jgi:ATP-dependent Clp protease adaptor protein ClpS
VAIEILGLMLAGAGASYGWWRMQRGRDSRVGLKQLESSFDGDATIVWGVATHEVTSRGHTGLWPLHLVYGLMQVEAFTDAIKKIGGNPDAIENRVLGALDAAAKDDATGMQHVGQILSHAYAVAQHQERKITMVDLWARLASHDVAKLLEVEAHELLFLLVHGMAMPEPDLPGRTDVHVILRNDDFTTQEFVTEILRDVFALGDGDAHTRMMETHTQGKTIVGRFKLAAARDKVISVRSRARAQMFPLWIALEDC